MDMPTFREWVAASGRDPAALLPLAERRLTDKARGHVPRKGEAFPSKHGEVGNYPMPDAAHARAAKGFAAMHHGKGSATYRRVAAKAGKLWGI